MRTVAYEDASCQTSLDIFPIVKYTGQALLSPWSCESLVLSEERMIGTIVAPNGRTF